MAPDQHTERDPGDRRDTTGSRAKLARRLDAASRLESEARAATVEQITNEAARGYALGVLGLAPTDATERLVRSALESTAKSRRGAPESHALLDETYLAVRTEVWRSQGGPLRGSAGRVLAVAALILVVVGFGAAALSILSAGEPEPAPVSTQQQSRQLAGRLVAINDAGAETPRSDVEVSVTAPDGATSTVSTGLDGEFVFDGLASERYILRVDVPAGLRLRGAADGRSAPVDLRTQEVGDLTLRLMRP